MSDDVRLQVGGVEIKNFLSYTIEANIYVADKAFSLELASPTDADPEAKEIIKRVIKKGLPCEIFVNGKRELLGIIDRIITGTEKEGRKLQVEGRDLMGLVVDSCCEEFFTLQDKTLKNLAEQLLKNVPFINRKNIKYQDGRMQGKSAGQVIVSPHKFMQIEPGMTVFEVLKNYAESRGLMFFSLPDGTFVFDKPKSGKDGKPQFKLVCRADGKENNIMGGEKIEDISKGYSKVTVMGQQQGMSSMGPTQINTKAVLEDKTFPFRKPLVVKDNNDDLSPRQHAQLLLDKMRFEALQLVYKVPGHSQDGKNWAINELCQVKDEALEMDGIYLIYGRVFVRNKRETFTTLKLGPPGVVV